MTENKFSMLIASTSQIQPALAPQYAKSLKAHEGGEEIRHLVILGKVVKGGAEKSWHFRHFDIF